MVRNSPKTVYRSIALGAGLLLSAASLVAQAPCVPSLPAGDVYAVNAGGFPVAGYTTDAFFSGGSVYANNSQQVTLAEATAPAPFQVYQDERQGGQFSYNFPSLTPNTTYAIILHFAELYFTLPAQRQFNVSINGNQVLTNFDIVAETGGPFRGIDEAFFVKSDASGHILINFSSGAVNQPIINAIEIRGDNN